MDTIAGILNEYEDRIRKVFGIGTNNYRVAKLEHQQEATKRIRQVLLTKIPKKKKFDSHAITEEQSVRGAKIYNLALLKFKRIINSL